MTAGPTGGDGLLVVDKPQGWTSHDVVARIRRLAGTKKVGHAGTLDPMATGVLVVAVGQATRLLRHLPLDEKAYDATIRLGQATTTDDAQGEVLEARPAELLDAGRIAGVAARFVGEIQQVPARISAVKVAGRRAYERVRSGEDVELAPRPVTVRAFDIGAVRPHDELTDVDATVVCSSGTYVRALARDLGAALGVGGHLTALRRTRVGDYTLAEARTMETLAADCSLLPMVDVVTRVFGRRDVPAEQARLVSHGGRLPATGAIGGPFGVFGPDGRLLALAEERDGATRPILVFAAAQPA